MIIRMTLEDNDCTQDIEKFAKKLFDRLYWSKDVSFYDNDYTKWYQAYKVQEELQKLLNPNITQSLTDEDKMTIRAKVFLEWFDFVDSLNLKEYGEDEARIKEYMRKNFDCSVSYDFKDKWENGEVVYYFTTNQKYITQ